MSDYRWQHNPKLDWSNMSYEEFVDILEDIIKSIKQKDKEGGEKCSIENSTD